MDDEHSEGYQLAPRPWVQDGEALVTWLRAQIDEDERLLKAASPPPWRATAEYYADAVYEDMFHIVNWDPARVLREVQAKRRILNECLKEVEREAATGRRYPASTAWALAVTTLRLLALPYADRPGYQESWRL